jgi:hypothetical protein
MWVKMVVLLFVALILYSLGSGLFFLTRDRSRSDRVVKALTWRICLSILLFILLFIGFGLGWIVPHNV